ncbi:MAG: hypothetical protein GYA33_13860 [Thermogutta sp.]|nr:hypothetical protein [Thermogutta sp.]
MRWLSEAYRLFSFLDAVYFAGNFLMRRSLRYALATLIVSAAGYLGNLIPGVQTYHARVVLLLPICVGLSMQGLGLALRMVPMLFKSRLTGVAQAADLDLMENYRKANQEAHLAALWDRVFRHEWAVGSHACRVREHAEECPASLNGEEGLPPDAARCDLEQFLARCRFALDRPQPEPRQRYYLGVDLRLLEDWYNGGYFDPHDVKLSEQYASSITLQAVREELGWTLRRSLRDLPLQLSAKLWFRLVTQAVSLRLGESVLVLNRRFDTDYFNVQALLWSGEEDQAWVAQFGPDARTVLLAQRRRVLERVFGNREQGRRMLDRFLLPRFLLAGALRAAYDPEYLDGSLGYDLWSDLRWAGRPTWRAEEFRRLTRRALRNRELLAPWLADLSRSQGTPPNGSESESEVARAIRVAVHVSPRLERLLAASRTGSRRSKKRAEAALAKEFGRIRKECCRYSGRLIALRVHHELTRIQREEYHRLLETLFDSCFD